MAPDAVVGEWAFRSAHLHRSAELRDAPKARVACEARRSKAAELGKEPERLLCDRTRMVGVFHRAHLCWEYLRRRQDYRSAYDAVRTALLAKVGTDVELLLDQRAPFIEDCPADVVVEPWIERLPLMHPRAERWRELSVALQPVFEPWSVDRMPNPRTHRPRNYPFAGVVNDAYVFNAWELRPDGDRLCFLRTLQRKWGDRLLVVGLNTDASPEELVREVTRLVQEARSRLGVSKRNKTKVETHELRIRAWDLKEQGLAHAEIDRKLYRDLQPTQESFARVLRRKADKRVRDLLDGARHIIEGDIQERPWLEPLL